MKVALCFIINYEHILNKEHIWREWIEPNKDIINIYFFYGNKEKIKSKWILENTIHPDYIMETSYYHVVPAYLSVMKFALYHDTKNQWFCFLTDSCCPIISPKRFRYLFYKNYNKSIMSWKKAWWNIDFHKRANLAMLPKELHLANDPWFILKRENVCHILDFIIKQNSVTKMICNGGLANESLFAIILYGYKQLESKNKDVISAITHITDWSRMTSATSPYIFRDIDSEGKNIQFINKELERNKYSIFIRKVAPEFPDSILRHYLFEQYEEDNKLVLNPPFTLLFTLKNGFFVFLFLVFLSKMFYIIQ